MPLALLLYLNKQSIYIYIYICIYIYIIRYGFVLYKLYIIRNLLYYVYTHRPHNVQCVLWLNNDHNSITMLL